MFCFCCMPSSELFVFFAKEGRFGSLSAHRAFQRNQQQKKGEKKGEKKHKWLRW